VDNLAYLSSQEKNLDDEVVRFAFTKFPNISLDIVHQNYCEFVTALEAEKKCACCMTIEMCSELLNTAGYKLAFTLQPNGWLKEEKRICEFHPKCPQSFL
jgi:hypothetical protein